MTGLKFSQESFGYLVDFPDGTFGLYDQKVEPLLASETEKAEIAEYVLDEMKISTDFHLNRPLVVWLEVTRACNLDCSHCYISAGKSRRGELTLEEWKNVIDDLSDQGVFSLIFAGGEPFLRKDFREILLHACSKDFTLSVVTNGHFLTEEILQGLPREKFRVTLSVDGIEAHNAIRGGDSTFELMKEKLELLKRLGFYVSVSTVISKMNIHELDEMLSWCQDEDIVFRTVTFNTLGRGITNSAEHRLDPEHAKASAEIFAKQKVFEVQKDKEIGRCVSKYFEYALSLMFTTKMEHCSRSIGYIASDGGVFPCVSAASTNTFGAGNVRQVPFSYLWETSFRDMRSITWDNFTKTGGACNGCDLNGPGYFCANRCPVMSLVLNRELFGCGASEFDRDDLRIRTKRLNELLGA